MGDKELVPGLLVRRHSGNCPMRNCLADFYIDGVIHKKKNRNSATVILRCQFLDCRGEFHVTVDLLSALKVGEKR